MTLIQKEWDYNKGSNRGSDQSGAQELDRITVQVDDRGADRKLDNWLNEITTSYYSDKVREWVREKVPLKVKSYFGW